jgi:hypothetical protein
MAGWFLSVPTIGRLLPAHYLLQPPPILNILIRAVLSSHDFEEDSPGLWDPCG